MKQYMDKIYNIVNTKYKKKFNRDLNQTTFNQFVKHYMVGGVGILINYSLFNILAYSGLDIKISNAITYMVLLVTMFILQKYFTYRMRQGSAYQPIMFVLNTAVYGFLDTLILILFVNVLQVVPMISKVISIVFLAPLSFLSQKHIVFREKKND